MKTKKRTAGEAELSESRQADVICEMQYIADTTPKEWGAYDTVRAVAAAKGALSAIRELMEALLLYHEAWNGCEADWRSAMRAASKNADKVLWRSVQKP